MIKTAALVLAFLPLTDAAFAGSDWPNLQAGHLQKISGCQKIPPTIKKFLGPCKEETGSDGTIHAPITSFYKIPYGKEFAITYLGSWPAPVSYLFELENGEARQLSFATGDIKSGFRPTTSLGETKVDPKTGKLISYWFIDSCGQDTLDYEWTYEIRDGTYDLVQTRGRNCNAGSWETLWELK